MSTGRRSGSLCRLLQGLTGSNRRLLPPFSQAHVVCSFQIETKDAFVVKIGTLESLGPLRRVAEVPAERGGIDYPVARILRLDRKRPRLKYDPPCCGELD